ncbi:MAG TPA: hypothetical protein VFA59_07645 [Vicinamibacterales bacterium]|nr:hypothetical protein [Vicinamibacterales bacterium]
MLLDADERPDEIDAAILVFITLITIVTITGDVVLWSKGNQPRLGILYGPLFAASWFRRAYRHRPAPERLRVEARIAIGLGIVYMAELTIAVLQFQFARDRWLIGGAVVYLVGVMSAWTRQKHRLEQRARG